jgi:hypothetical protein
MSEERWQPGDRVRVLCGGYEGAIGTVVGSVGSDATAIRIEVADDFLTLTLADDILGRDDNGGGGVREPRRPIGPNDVLGSEEPS